MSWVRETDREEKATMFHDTRESVCVRAVPMFRGVGEAALLRAFPNGMGA